MKITRRLFASGKVAVLIGLAALALTNCAALDTMLLPADYRVTPSPYLTPTRRPTSTPTPTGTPVVTPAPTLVTGPDWSRDLAGEVYFFLVDPAHVEPRLARLPAGCAACPAPEILPAPPGGVDTPAALAWSPDGSLAALVTRAGLYAFDPAGRTWKLLSDLEDIQPRVSWSAEGERLAFQARRDDLPGIFVVRPDGSGLKTATSGRLINLPAAELSGWQGERIIFIAGGPEDYHAYVTTLENPRPARFSDSPVFRERADPLPAMPLSPDGQWIAYGENDPLVGSIVSLIPLRPEVDPRMLLSSRDGRVGGYAWSPGEDAESVGEWLLIWSQYPGWGQVERVRVDGSGLEIIYQGEQVRAAVPAPDGGAALLLEEAAGGVSRLAFILPGRAGRLDVTAQGVGAQVSWRAPSWRALTKP